MESLLVWVGEEAVHFWITSLEATQDRTLAFVGRATLLPTCFCSRQVPLASNTWNFQGPLSHGCWNLCGLIFAPVSAPGLVSGFEQWLLSLVQATCVSFANCFCKGSQQWAVRAPQSPQESFPALSSDNLKSFWGILKHCFVVKKLSFLSSEYTQLLRVYLHELWNGRNLVFYRSQGQKLISELHKRKTSRMWALQVHLPWDFNGACRFA